jgi:hypothetical protein
MFARLIAGATMLVRATAMLTHPDLLAAALIDAAPEQL